MQEKKEKTTEEVVSTEYIYQVNENQEINTLIGDYYKAIVDCDLEAYKLTLTEPELVTDMVVYERKKELIYDYTNINVYTIPGLNQDEYIAYVTYNLQIAEVESTPIDIQSYYIVLQDGKLKIENRQFSDEITGYMNEKLGETDIQNLYKTAHDDTVRCLEEDPTFAEFYEKMNNPIQEEQE